VSRSPRDPENADRVDGRENGSLTSTLLVSPPRVSIAPVITSQRRGVAVVIAF
jgi:hypothetical protein